MEKIVVRVEIEIPAELIEKAVKEAIDKAIEKEPVLPLGQKSLETEESPEPSGRVCRHEGCDNEPNKHQHYCESCKAIRSKETARLKYANRKAKLQSIRDAKRDKRRNKAMAKAREESPDWMPKTFSEEVKPAPKRVDVLPEQSEGTYTEEEFAIFKEGIKHAKVNPEDL